MLFFDPFFKAAVTATAAMVGATVVTTSSALTSTAMTWGLDDCELDYDELMIGGAVSGIFSAFILLEILNHPHAYSDIEFIKKILANTAVSLVVLTVIEMGTLDCLAGNDEEQLTISHMLGMY